MEKVVSHLILLIHLADMWDFHAPVAAILDCSKSDHQGDTSSCLRWFLETLYRYLSPYQISKTCHQVHDFMNWYPAKSSTLLSPLWGEPLVPVTPQKCHFKSNWNLKVKVNCTPTPPPPPPQYIYIYIYLYIYIYIYIYKGHQIWWSYLERVGWWVMVRTS